MPRKSFKFLKIHGALYFFTFVEDGHEGGDESYGEKAQPHNLCWRNFLVQVQKYF
jgi:hypothetical protein